MMQRPIASAIVFLLVAIGLIILVSFSFHHYLVHWLFDGFKDPVHFGHKDNDFAIAGNYGSFIVGVPVALIGTLVGLIASYAIAHYTNTKDEIPIYSYIERIMADMFIVIRELCAELEILIAEGNKFKSRSIKLRDRLVEMLNDITQATDVFPEPLEYIHPDKEVQAFLIDHVPRIEEAIRGFEVQFDSLFSTSYGSLFIRRQIRDTMASSSGTATAYLMNRIPDSWHRELSAGWQSRISAERHTTSSDMTSRDIMHDLDHANDPRQLTNNIRASNGMTKGIHLVYAAILLPITATSIELLGAVIYIKVFNLKSPIKLKDDRRIISYSVNLGAAWIITLCQYIPRESAIVAVFKDIFQNKSRVASNFIRNAAPSPSFFLTTTNEDMILGQVKRLDHLILVHTDAGVEPYKSTRHGALPDAASFT